MQKCGSFFFLCKLQQTCIFVIQVKTMKAVLGFLFILCTLHVHGQYSRINDQDDLANEPSIAISKTDPNIIVAGTNINWIYYSHDAGQSWESYRLGSSLGFYGDPVLHAADNGDFYLVHLSKTPGKKWGDWFDRIVFQKSSDGGKSFTNGVGIGYNQDRTQDKPWLNTDNEGNLYLTWTEFDKYGSDSAHHFSKIMFSMSKDQGASWSKPIVISDEMGGCKDDDNTLEGATTAVNSKGEIFVSWAGKGNIYFDKSSDGGKSFGKDKIVALQEGGWVLDIPHFYRSNGMPFLQVDRSGGKNHDFLYLAFTSKENGINRVQLLKSTDGGNVWKPKSRFKSELDGQQFFPNLSVDPKTGLISLGFYDAPKSLNYYYANYHRATSRDGGMYFKVEKLNEIPFPIPGKSVFFGDYSDVDVTADRSVAIFTSYTPPTWANGAKLNVMVHGTDGGKRYKEDRVYHIWREGELSLLLPPNSKVKMKFKRFQSNVDFKLASRKFANQSKEWKEEKIALESFPITVVKYKVKEKRDGHFLPIKTKIKTSNLGVTTVEVEE